MKSTLALAALFSLFLLGGCGDAKTNTTVAADPVAASDPNSKAKQLLKEFAGRVFETPVFS